ERQRDHEFLERLGAGGEKEKTLRRDIREKMGSTAAILAGNRPQEDSWVTEVVTERGWGVAMQVCVVKEIQSAKSARWLDPDTDIWTQSVFVVFLSPVPLVVIDFTLTAAFKGLSAEPSHAVSISSVTCPAASCSCSDKATVYFGKEILASIWLSLAVCLTDCTPDASIRQTRFYWSYR
ncbi:hypothetical protein KUCAC02_013684, partial [Chaenocephalus aceratus]